MSPYYGEWAPYVTVAARRRQAEREVQKLLKLGAVLSPIKLEGKKIAATFWGKAWCDNLESYRDYENRLPRGRSYVRNGSVIHLKIAPREVTAMVSGSSVYQVKIGIREVSKARWAAICADCSGGIDSLVELLQGRLSKGVMERICRQGEGLFPNPAEIDFSCSCPDYASMCKHVAATLYAVGARLDATPELLFQLRAVKAEDLVADIGKVLPIGGQGPAAGKLLEADDMAALFGLDMGDSTEPADVTPTPRALVAAAATTGGPAAGTKNAAKKSVQKADALAQKSAPRPVEWWKVAPPAKAKRAAVRTTSATRPATGQRAKAAT